MTSQPNFPGMNPYLERPDIWPEIHYGLISGLMRTLNPVLNPKYRAAVDKRVYLDSVLVGIPDTTVIQQTPNRTTTSTSAAVLSQPERVAIPMLEEVTERFLEIREVATRNVITVIEVLSPKNKRSGEGRSQYLKKRQTLLSSQTHLVEIDLLRSGESMPVQGGCIADYQILVSRANERPAAERYPFDLREPIPVFLLPLSAAEVEPAIDLAALLEQASQEAALDLVIDYSMPPEPPLSEDDMTWLDTLR
ncbi:hypothetical protein MC7420_6114 [Coleofasciculus chthonoplastes PCC 7420]|uniref:DUF4058 domain-containing protein n=1 Tax=Coleofasciculus chthonoplastes PCC 7420 TaxID=118168 RepID=B4VTL3_9CYAN|nr:DUF4058 family protein [Coleofasciculus chthonoplastes]EDX74636.1 hypothetical protein MC7420_6114 [Coleofasciculus chthonoplastes PCC 7420]